MTNVTHGWEAMNVDGTWTWWPKKPYLDNEGHWCMDWSVKDSMKLLPPTRIDCSDKVADHRKSLRRSKRSVEK